MNLKSINISQIEYGDKAGQYRGTAKFSCNLGEVNLALNEPHIDAIFRVCAASIEEVARKAANELTVHVIDCVKQEQLKQLEAKP